MSRPATQYIKVYGYRLRETEKAVQFEVHKVGDDELETPKREWFPFSQMKSQNYSTQQDRTTFDDIQVNDWVLRQKELI
jgi:exosome complex RNA-binding protein Csl4